MAAPDCPVLAYANDPMVFFQPSLSQFPSGQSWNVVLAAVSFIPWIDPASGLFLEHT